MRLLAFISLLLIFSSCAHNRIRKVRVAPRHTVHFKKGVDRHVSQQAEEHSDVIEVKVVDRHKTKVSEALTSHEIPQDLHVEMSIESASMDYEVIRNTLNVEEETALDAEEELTEEEQAQIQRAAIEAEQHAKKAKNFLLTALLIVLIPIIGWIMSPIFFGIGWFHLAKARNSRYITGRGEMYEETASSLWLTYIILAALFIILTTIIVIALL